MSVVQPRHYVGLPSMWGPECVLQCATGRGLAEAHGTPRFVTKIINYLTSY